MPLILGFIFLVFGIWQMFMDGSYSSILGPLGTILGFLIILLSSWKIGIIIAIIFTLYASIGSIIGSDKKKIKKILEAYIELKKETNLSENKICREIIAQRLYSTRYANPLRPRSVEEARDFVEGIFKEEKLTIEKTCVWIVYRENKGGWDVDLTEFENKIKKKEELFDKVNEIKKDIF